MEQETFICLDRLSKAFQIFLWNLVAIKKKTTLDDYRNLPEPNCVFLQDPWFYSLSLLPPMSRKQEQPRTIVPAVWARFILKALWRRVSRLFWEKVIQICLNEECHGDIPSLWRKPDMKESIQTLLVQTVYNQINITFCWTLPLVFVHWGTSYWWVRQTRFTDVWAEPNSTYMFYFSL